MLHKPLPRSWEKTILLGAARSDPSRYAITVCYLRDERDEVFGPAQRVDGLDIDYVEVRERHSFDRRIWRALRALVRDRRIDIVHAHEYKTDLLAWLLARCQGNIRSALRELYDCWAVSRLPLPRPAETA